MSEFTAITTQEDFDKAIQKRLAQKEREMTEHFKEYMSPDDVKELRADCERKINEAQEAVKVVEDKLKDKDTTVDELTKRAEAAENSLLKNQIAYENKLPLELAARLVGNTKEELTKDAESLASLIKPSNTPPLHSTDTRTNGAGISNQAAMSGLLEQLKTNM